jgi:hypothetical protein
MQSLYQQNNLYYAQSINDKKEQVNDHKNNTFSGSPHSLLSPAVFKPKPKIGLGSYAPETYINR